jgi:hypothetical protein
MQNSEQEDHSWVTNGLSQTIPYSGTTENLEGRIEQSPEDLESIAREEGMLIGSNAPDGRIV